MRTLFAPSLMCMDLLKVREQIEILNDHCQMYHIDIMDGHFVQNLSLSVDFVKALRPITELPLDCHLMVTAPERYIDGLIAAGANYISLHAETINGQAFRLIDKIKRSGCKVGVALNPETPLSSVHAYLSRVDLMTVMAIDPGFAGQTFIPEALEKVRAAGERKRRSGLDFILAVDGSCNARTYKILSEAGNECFIVGSSGLFGLDKDLASAYLKMERIFREQTAS